MYFSKLPSKHKHGKTPVPTQSLYNKGSHRNPQTNQSTSPCCCPALPEQHSWGQWHQSWLLHTSVPLRTLLMPDIHTSWISDLLLFYKQQAMTTSLKKICKSQVLLYFLHTKSPRFSLEIAACCAPALKTVLVTALKHGSPQAIRKVTHGNS